MSLCPSGLHRQEDGWCDCPPSIAAQWAHAIAAHIDAQIMKCFIDSGCPNLIVSEVSGKLQGRPCGKPTVTVELFGVAEPERGLCHECALIALQEKLGEAKAKRGR